MNTLIQIAIEELKTNGWTFLISEQKPDWWIDEVFELHSTWNPVGVKIYFTLDVDPETTNTRRKGEMIISVSLSKEIPTKRLSTKQFTFYLSELHNNGRKELITTANKLRNEL